MKHPIAISSAAALLSLAVVGSTVYYTRTPVIPAAVNTAVVAPEKTPEPAPAAETTTEVAVVAPPPKTVPAVEAENPKAVSPSFDTVRVEPSGEAVIAGRAEPDADVSVKWNGAVVGTAKSGADGTFVIIPDKPLTKGTGALTLEVSKNGEVTVSEGSVVVAVKDNAPALVAKVDPVAPTQVIQTGAATDAPKDVQLTAVDYDTAGNIVFSGKAAPNSVVRFYVDNAAVGEGAADATGNWSFAGTSTVAPGAHTLRADVVDATGKVLSRIELPFLREEVATVAAAQTAAAEPAPPAPAAEPPTQVAVAPVVVEEVPQKIVIQPGNSLWKLSREVYGKGRMYTILYEANRDQLKSPNKIFPGQILTAPKQN